MPDKSLFYSYLKYLNPLSLIQLGATSALHPNLDTAKWDRSTHKSFLKKENVKRFRLLSVPTAFYWPKCRGILESVKNAETIPIFDSEGGFPHWGWPHVSQPQESFSAFHSAFYQFWMHLIAKSNLFVSWKEATLGLYFVACVWQSTSWINNWDSSTMSLEDISPLAQQILELECVQVCTWKFRTPLNTRTLRKSVMSIISR